MVDFVDLLFPAVHQLLSDTFKLSFQFLQLLLIIVNVNRRFFFFLFFLDFDILGEVEQKLLFLCFWQSFNVLFQVNVFRRVVWAGMRRHICSPWVWLYFLFEKPVALSLWFGCHWVELIAYEDNTLLLFLGFWFWLWFSCVFLGWVSWWFRFWCFDEGLFFSH